MPWPAPTDEELARAQQAIGDAADDWAQEVDGDVPFDPPGDGDPSDYAQHHLLVSATPEQRGRLWDRVEAGLADVHHLPEAS